MNARLYKIIFMVAVVALTAACTNTNVYELRDEVRDDISVKFGNEKAIPISVELRMTEALRNARWSREIHGMKYEMPLGKVLSRYTEITAQKLFTSVVVTNDRAGPASSGAQAILRARPVAIERTRGATAFGNSKLSVLLEWSMQDAEGQLLWVDTIHGLGEANSGNLWTYSSNARDQITAMVRDLFKKSFDKMTSSYEIGAYSRRVAH